ncbi:MAG: hypothetical protein U9R79_12520 [Armatimonadota bacterium]|nr:hypothetical protein [Armatimonadota bacterium]
MYRPRDFGMGDFWFLEGPDVLHLYYLELEQPPHDERAEVGIGHATSTDGVHWSERGRVIGRGEPGAFDDAAILAGSAVTVGGRYYMLYTGLSRADSVQRTGVLTSGDMVHWERFAEVPVLEPDERWYETAPDVGPDEWVSWRDPCLWWCEEEGAWYAFITATERGDGPRNERGCVGLARSEDMMQWEALPPVAAPGLCRAHEAPQVVRIGARWYLLYSTHLWAYSDEARARKPLRWQRSGTHYLVSDDPLGEWRVPQVDVVAGAMADSHHGAKAQRVGGDLLLYSWGPTRRELAVPMRLDAAPDGSLCALYWEGLEAWRGRSLCGEQPRELQGGWQSARGVMIADAGGGPSVAGCQDEAMDLCVAAPVVPDVAARAAVGVSDAAGTLAAIADVPGQEAAIVRLPSGETLASVPWEVTPVRPAHLRLVADGEVLSLYVDDEFALSAFVEGRGEGAVRLVALDGSAEFRDMEGFTLKL